MWIREALTDAPRGARLGIALGWASTALLAVAAVGIGWVVDAILGDGRMLGPILVAVIAALLGAACGGIAEALPGRIQAAEERSWRQRVLRRVLRLDAPTPPTPRGRPGQTGTNSAAKPGGKPGAAQPGWPVHPHAAGQPTSGDGALVDAATVGVEKTANYRAGFLGPTLASFTRRCSCSSCGRYLWMRSAR